MTEVILNLRFFSGHVTEIIYPFDTVDKAVTFKESLMLQIRKCTTGESCNLMIPNSTIGDKELFIGAKVFDNCVVTVTVKES